MRWENSAEASIRTVGSLLWNKDKTKVDKPDEIRKTVMSSMRLLAKIYIDFEKQTKLEDKNTDGVKSLSDRENWTQVSAQ